MSEAFTFQLFFSTFQLALKNMSRYYSLQVSVMHSQRSFSYHFYFIFSFFFVKKTGFKNWIQISYQASR